MLKMGVAVFALTTTVLSGAESPDRVLTLDQSVQTGLQNSQSLLSASDDVRMAQQRIVEARSLYYPTLALNMNASRYRAKDYVALPGEFGSTVLSPSADPDEFYAGRAQLRQMLYNGGRNKANLQLAEAALAQARIREESIRSQVTVDAVRTFFDVLLAEKRWALAEKARQEVLAFSVKVRGPDATTLNAMASRLRRRQADARRDLEAARLAYLSAVGLELYTTVELTGDLTTTPIQESLPKLLARAQEARLEIRGTEYQREMDRLAVNLTESERNPVVVFGAAYELNNSDFPLDRAFWNATLNVNLPIFDGFASRSRIRQSRLLASQNRIARAEVEDRINREVRETYNDVMFWQSEIGERKKDLDRLLATTNNERGSATVDSALSRSELMEAWEAYWESIHGHRVARAKLEKAVGLPLAP
jgi:outer membrane protein TolC